MSNFNFQWTKTLYQNNYKLIAFFFTFFKSYECIVLYEITPEEKVLVGAREDKLQKPQISQNEIFCMTILPVFFVNSCEI